MYYHEQRPLIDYCHQNGILVGVRGLMKPLDRHGVSSSRFVAKKVYEERFVSGTSL